MSKDDDQLRLESGSQMSFPFVDQKDHGVEYVGETREGYGLFRKKEPHGGYSYWTDEVPPAMCVYDEALTNVVAMFEAMEHLGIAKDMWEHLGRLFDFDK